MIKSALSVSSFGSVAAGLIAICAASACSNDDPKSEAAAADPAVSEREPPPKAPPSTSNEATDDDDDKTAAPGTCMDTSKPFDVGTVAYHPPAIEQGACTEADIAMFDGYMRDHPQASVNDIESSLAKQSQRCSDCAFGAIDDEKWAVIVKDASSATVNGGGCVSAVSGKDACGKAYQEWNTCLNTVCASCTEEAERTECSNGAQQPNAPCGDPSGALFDACGNDVNAFLKTCFGGGIGAVLGALCGPPSPQGGT